LKAKIKAGRAKLNQWASHIQTDDAASKYISAEAPLRAELFSADQMDRHGRFLASSHQLASGRRPDQLLARLIENYAVLMWACGLLTNAVKTNRRITPAGEWLLDNFYLIEEQIRTARRHFPKTYSQELPVLANGPSAGLPRVYDIALEAIAHGDGRVDPESLNRFIAAYQKGADLKLGELWAIPIMLRLALIENLRRVGARVAAGMLDRNEADTWADQMIKTSEEDPKSLILVIADMARSNPPMVSSFVAELARRLQGHSSALALPLTWIEQRLSETGLTIEQLVQSETQSLAANQVSISNSIGSLRFLGAMDWREFVESMSSVEHKLREDPSNIYAKMNFATRDRYRHVIEKVAKRSKLSEKDVARKAVQLAFLSAAKPRHSASERESHVGFYLVDKGLPQLEQAVEARVSAMEAVRRFDKLAERFPFPLYFGAIAVLTSAIVFGLFKIANLGDFTIGAVVPMLAVMLLGASQLAVSLTNWLATLIASPVLLPRMDFSKGIPSQSRTLVVVPTMLSSIHGAEALIEALEVRFLANRDHNLHFGLLTDFPDAATESLSGDEGMLAFVRGAIDALNDKYGIEREDKFYLFHRPRRWNEHEKVWMGYERKRGKLADLNNLLRLGSAEPFSLILGDTNILRDVKYVITLDTDTQLPREAARELVATMSHPLNHASRAPSPIVENATDKKSASKSRIVPPVRIGYGILQPRVAVSLPSTNRSRYAQLYGSEPGLDPYTRAVSDVYQDLFEEGSFIGKGIYDVAVFEETLKDRFPDNRILSHDLLEGCYARSGLLSDVQFYEDYPSSYSTDVSRRHRWIRGDWQIASWLFSRVPSRPVAGETKSARTKNLLSQLSQWKIFDNLRRSLVPAAMMVLFVAGWSIVPSAVSWTLAVLGILFLPMVATSSFSLVRKPKDVLFRQHVADVGQSTARQTLQTLFALATLPYEALFSLDAVIRTSMRVLFTKHRLLEWKPASGPEQRIPKMGIAQLFENFKSMWICPAAAISIGLYLGVQRPLVLAVAAPVLFLWLIAPAVAWWVSRPLDRRPVQLDLEQTMFLRALTRRTWRFFERFVASEDNWLPPDNYQEHPAAVVAHRTSPTNMGMALLANLSAYDFAYISAGRLVERTANTLESMLKLDRYQGHFYNWYDTIALRPLAPLYVSTVDSGNLCGHLLTLRPGLLQLQEQRIISPRLFEGLADTLENLIGAPETTEAIPAATIAGQSSEPDASDATQAAAKNSATPRSPIYTPLLLQLKRDIESACDSNPVTVSAVKSWLEKITRTATQLVHESGDRRADATGSFVAQSPANLARLALEASAQKGDDAAGTTATKQTEFTWWANAIRLQCDDALNELAWLMPWSHFTAATGKTIGNLPGNANIESSLERIPTLHQIARLHDSVLQHLRVSPDKNAQNTALLAEVMPLVSLAGARARERITKIEMLARQAGELALVDYSFLYDTTQHLMTVGYNVEQHRIDTGRYDLLASEARLASFVAIAQGKIPQESWFALGRNLTTAGGEAILLSWSGSMFEYLMPTLVMPAYQNTLLDQTCIAAVKRQIAYGNMRGVPWGISESGYNAVDASLNYQYRAFGVPGLGLKRGLSDDLVIAPYASALALMVMPEAACENLQRLDDDGVMGRYGMYEAVDFTPARLPRGQSSAVVRSFMAHHQGMSLLSFAYVLLDQPMQKRFESDPQFQATTLLLQERIPAATSFHIHAPDLSDVSATAIGPVMPMRVLRSPHTPTPEVQLLSNGRYHVMVTNAGGGYTRWKEFGVTRWHEDGTRDNWGAFCYICDVASGQFWSTAHQPTLKAADAYEAIFLEGRVEFRRRDGDYETHTEIVVSPEDDIELRRTRISNRSRVRRTIEITSYAEVVLAVPAADALHPAFSNLFVQTEIIPDRQAILCTRRPRAENEQVPCMFHLMAAHNAEVIHVSYETDRMRFIGRTRGVDSPIAMNEAGALSGSQGSVLDPIVSIRYRITIEPEQTATIDVVSGMSDTRDGAYALADKYRDRRLADRVFDLAWTHSWVNLRQINATESDAQLYGRLAGSIIYANPGLRADAGVLLRNLRGQSGLWGYAISGDLPIVLLQITDMANIELVRQLVQAHAYWRLKGLAVDLVIWNEDHAGYRQLLHEQIMDLIAAGIEANQTDRPGGIFVRAAEHISTEDRTLFQTVARVIIADTRGTLAEQVNRRSLNEKFVDKQKDKTKDSRDRDAYPPRLVPIQGATIKRIESIPHVSAGLTPVNATLQLFNGFGGFTADGREYVISTSTEQLGEVATRAPTTPAPWSNVIANAQFGTVISEAGAAYTWSENAHEFRLTPWGDDPVTDSSGEAFYVRDEESGAFFSPTPLPAGGAGAYVTRHGFGYSIFEHEEDGVHTEMTVFVDLEAPIKFSTLKVRNISGRARKLSATGFVEWVLGDLRAKSAMHIVTEIESASGAICARNAYSTEFGNRITFFDAGDSTSLANVSISADRVEFIGRNANLKNPAAMRRTRLSNKVGAGLDPCAAIQVPFDLADGEEREITFRLGAAGRHGSDDIGAMIQRLRSKDEAGTSLKNVRDYWTKTLSAVQVHTPDAALNVLANGWLVYQTLACRLWARSGYYQSGGAYGFRDQLQDTMALIHSEPRLVREHLLRSASRQFSDGDVQHWWHPPSGRGVRTRCSDDFLWLPQAACRYVLSTGDVGVLNESIHFLEGRQVNQEDDSYYDLPTRSDTKGTLYQHCVRAIERGLRFGERGLPLMGSGDWNDGMNLVGMQGKGESVWLGFFLYDTMVRFERLARAHGDAKFADRCKTESEQLQRNLNLHGWDGGWFRRAYFDDGTPLGSSTNAECQIDSIAQSWSVLSGAGEPGRSLTAMDALDKRLVRRDDKLILLLDPPFDTSTLNPGYIKGYVPGVRENGGQYTHGAIWAAMAFAKLGDSARAWDLFNMINPVNHAITASEVAIYKVEPYVIAADVYGVAPHTGRGGWTWYTGSAGWMYRLILESLVGIQVEENKLRLLPCLNKDWTAFKVHYRYRETVYHVEVNVTEHPAGPRPSPRVIVDGLEQRDAVIVMRDDRQEHRVNVII
jgi:cyclic beta-1,2-glucan synthetase